MPVSSRSRRVLSVGFTIVSASPVVSVARLLMASRARIPVESMNRPGFSGRESATNRPSFCLGLGA